MDIETFLYKIKSIFEETPHNLINSETKFKDLPEWNSLIVLSLMVVIEDNFSILITPMQIENSSTIEDLYNSIDFNNA